MYLAGHLAVGYVAGRGRLSGHGARLGLLLPVFLGALLPDLIDKPIQLCGLSVYGRTFGHSVWLWGCLCLLWMVARSKRLGGAAALGWLVVGGSSHLAADLIDDVVEGLQSSSYAFSTWGGWPYTNPDMWDVRVPNVFARRTDTITVLELATLAVTWALMFVDGRRARDRR